MQQSSTDYSVRRTNDVVLKLVIFLIIFGLVCSAGGCREYGRYQSSASPDPFYWGSCPSINELCT